MELFYIAAALVVFTAAWWTATTRRRQPAHAINVEVRQGRRGREYLAVCRPCGVLPKQLLGTHAEATDAAVLHYMHHGGSLQTLPRKVAGQ